MTHAESPPRRTAALALALCLLPLAACRDGGGAAPPTPAASLVQAGIRDGSFEESPPGRPPSSAWEVNDVKTVVRPVEEGDPGEDSVGFPSAGARFLQIDAGHRGPATRDDYLETASHARQEFRAGDLGMVLALDVAFVSYEIVGEDRSNDFMAVDVLAGDRRVNLALIDNATGELPLVTFEGKPATRKLALAVDLREAFPGSDGDTAFTLVVTAANANDDGMDSRVFLDAVRLLPELPPAPFACEVFKDGEGRWRLRSSSPRHPGAVVQHLITTTLSEPTGSGPFFGVAFDPEVIRQQALPPGTAPHHVRLDGHGRYVSEPLAYPPGTRIDYVGILHLPSPETPAGAAAKPRGGGDGIGDVLASLAGKGGVECSAARTAVLE